jgi:hypothetical protein
MNISEIEDKIDHPLHKKEFRKLDVLNKAKLFSKLYNDKLLLRDNMYFNYHTLSKVVDELIKDINLSIEQVLKEKELDDEVFFFLDSSNSYELHLICWKHDKNVSVEQIYKKALRYTKLGALVD